MKKSLLTLFLALISLSSWAQDAIIDQIFYYLDNSAKTAEVAAGPTNDYYPGNVIIPSTIYFNGEEYSVTSIGEKAFYDCSRLTSVTIPNSVKSIGNYAFSGCGRLTSVTIPNSVTNIGWKAFDHCRRLTSFKVENDNQYYCSEDNVLFNKDKTDLLYCVESKTGDYTIPNSVLWIIDSAFDNCCSLTSVTIPNSVTCIGNDAFQYCSSLTSVNIPNSVVQIGECAFWDCTGLTSVDIPNSVVWIGECAFLGCTGLTSVTIPNSVKSIEHSTFEGCSSLTSVDIPNSVTSIGNNAFQECSNLTSVDIPNSVTSIGDYAFYYCSSLTSVTMGNSVSIIGRDSFFGCFGLTSVNISDIDPWCYIHFVDSSSNPLCFAHHLYLNGDEVTNLEIPNTVNIIREFAFTCCTCLTSVDIPNSVVWIGNGAFSDCTGLTMVNISDIAAWCNIKFVNASSNPLCYAHHLYLNGDEVTNLEIPNTVASIEQMTFTGCSNLTSVNIPISVKRIGKKAFSNCENIEDVYCYAEQIPEMEDEVFKDSYVESASLYVPDYLVVKYKKANQWKNFGTIKGISEIPYELSYYVDNELYKRYKYQKEEEIIPEETPIKEGYTFSGWSEIPEFMPDHDVDVYGSFSINSYKVSYYVDENLVHEDEVVFGETFELWEYVPETDDITFNGWIGEKYDTMPAHDISYKADITSGISYVYGNSENVEGIYTLDGKNVEKIHQGVYLLRMNDGTMRKYVSK